MKHQVHGVVDGEGSDEAEQPQVEDADEEREPAPEAVGDVASDWKHQQCADAAHGPCECSQPVLTS